MQSICFVDDQKDELERFQKVFGTRFSIGAATNIDDAVKNLGGRKPDLFVLDMYIGKRPPNDQEIADMQKARKEFVAAESKFYELLERYDQHWEKGFQNLKDVRELYGKNQAVVFFSRKARFEDAIRAQENGVKIIKKPDPHPASLVGSPRDLDQALAAKLGDLAQEFSRAINASTFWARHRDGVRGSIGGVGVGFIAGVAAGLFLHYAIHIPL